MLGNLIESALVSVGVTSSRIEKWLGRPCGCDERRDKLNALTLWAIRALRVGNIDSTVEYLERIVKEQ